MLKPLSNVQCAHWIAPRICWGLVRDGLTNFPHRHYQPGFHRKPGSRCIVVPRHISAEFATDDRLHIEAAGVGLNLTIERFRPIVYRYDGIEIS